MSQKIKTAFLFISISVILTQVPYINNYVTNILKFIPIITLLFLMRKNKIQWYVYWGYFLLEVLIIQIYLFFNFYKIRDEINTTESFYPDVVPIHERYTSYKGYLDWVNNSPEYVKEDLCFWLLTICTIWLISFVFIMIYQRQSHHSNV
jgi:hypothetical protein